jgi:hypothetical protein
MVETRAKAAAVMRKVSLGVVSQLEKNTYQ